jgi:hypothetical protein
MQPFCFYNSITEFAYLFKPYLNPLLCMALIELTAALPVVYCIDVTLVE